MEKNHKEINKSDDLIKRSDLLEHIREFTSINSGYFENPELLERVIREMPAAPPVCVGIVSFDEEELRRIVDEKVKAIEIDVQEIRNRAIEEFKEELYCKSTDFKNIESDGYEMLSYEDVCMVAERMKGEKSTSDER